MEYLYAFERLDVWQSARQYTKMIYHLTEHFDPSEKFGLSSQIQRATVSIASNIAEGTGRPSPKEQIHFVEIAYASLMETYCQLTLALDLGYINENDLSTLKPIINKIAAQLSVLRKSIMQKNEGC